MNHLQQLSLLHLLSILDPEGQPCEHTVLRTRIRIIIIGRIDRCRTIRSLEKAVQSRLNKEDRKGKTNEAEDHAGHMLLLCDFSFRKCPSQGN